MTKKQLPFFIGFFVLMFGAMACACLGSGVGLSGAQATVNAALTQGAAAATSASGGNTTVGATATAGGTGGTGSGGLSDVPVIEGDKTNLVTTAQSVSYITKTDLATVSTFYKDAMPKNGWTADPSTTVESSNATILGFKKGSRQALVTLGKDPSSGQTAVAIVVQ